MRLPWTEWQFLTKCVETHLYYKRNDIELTFWMLGSILSNVYPTTFLTICNKMAAFVDFVNRKCILHMCKHPKVVSNKVRIRSVYLCIQIVDIENAVRIDEWTVK